MSDRLEKQTTSLHEAEKEREKDRGEKEEEKEKDDEEDEEEAVTMMCRGLVKRTKEDLF